MSNTGRHQGISLRRSIINVCRTSNACGSSSNVATPKYILRTNDDRIANGARNCVGQTDYTTGAAINRNRRQHCSLCRHSTTQCKRDTDKPNLKNVHEIPQMSLQLVSILTTSASLAHIQKQKSTPISLRQPSSIRNLRLRSQQARPRLLLLHTLLLPVSISFLQPHTRSCHRPSRVHFP